MVEPIRRVLPGVGRGVSRKYAPAPAAARVTTTEIARRECALALLSNNPRKTKLSRPRPIHLGTILKYEKRTVNVVSDSKRRAHIGSARGERHRAPIHQRSRSSKDTIAISAPRATVQFRARIQDALLMLPKLLILRVEREGDTGAGQRARRASGRTSRRRGTDASVLAPTRTSKVRPLPELSRRGTSR